MYTGKQPSAEFSLEALRSGDRAEFARLVETYSGVIYRLAMKMLNNPQDAEDILQETFIKAYRHLSNFDGRSSLSTWLYRIGTNEALMLLRKRKQNFVSIEDPMDGNDGDQEQEPLQIMDWCCMPEEEMMTAEARLYLDQAVDRLPSSLKVVFLLRDIEGLSTAETADVLNLSETAVKTRLSRGRLQLRELLTAYFSERHTKKLAEAGRTMRAPLRGPQNDSGYVSKKESNENEPRELPPTA